MKHVIVHIVDDASWGGVNRLLDCLENAPFGLLHDQHKILRISRGTRHAPQIEADVIVSHMSICWKNVPFFSSLRATYPETSLIHVEHSYSEHYVALNVEKRDRFDGLMNLSYAMFDKVVAVSTPQREWISRRNYCQEDQLVTIPSCVNLAPFQRVANVTPEGPVTVGAIGRFHEQKGFDILVDAFVRYLPETIHLRLIGDGPERAKLMKKAHGKANILFQESTSEPALEVAKCDIIAMPSRWEPYGLVAIEAMSALRPVLCAKVDGLKQHIASGAIAIEENTALGWSSVLQGLCERRVVNDLPRASDMAGAEWQFINNWNTLVRGLTTAELTVQKAA